jgi:hypothetical protein
MRNIWFWQVIAILGWSLGAYGAYEQGNLIQLWKNAASEMFFIACDQKQERFFVGISRPGHMIEFNCFQKGDTEQGAIFSLPQIPDVRDQP